MRYHHRDYSYDTEEELQVEDAVFLSAVASVPLRMLQALALGANVSLNLDLLSTALQAVGHQLSELSLSVRTDDIDRLASLIVDHCKSLRRFGYDGHVRFMDVVGTLAAKHFLAMITAIPSLTALKMNYMRLVN